MVLIFYLDHQKTRQTFHSSSSSKNDKLARNIRDPRRRQNRKFNKENFDLCLRIFHGFVSPAAVPKSDQIRGKVRRGGYTETWRSETESTDPGCN